MIVKRTSWHYRFNAWKTTHARTFARKSLCSYFWFTIWNMFWLVFWPVVAVAILYVLGFGMIDDTKAALFSWWTSNPSGMWQIVSYPFVGAVFLTSIVVAGCAVFATLFFLGFAFRYVRAKIKKEHVDRKPSLVVEYIKARKHKVCPIIEFEDAK